MMVLLRQCIIDVRSNYKKAARDVPAQGPYIRENDHDNLLNIATLHITFYKRQKQPIHPETAALGTHLASQ